MKPARYLPVLLLLSIFGCKKNDPPVHVGCPVPMKLTGLRSQGGVGQIDHNADGTLKGYTWFNNGQLGEYPGTSDTTIFDTLGRLLFYKRPFNGGRQSAQYFYDGMNRVVRTVTHTGNGIDYLQDLAYQDGDVVDMDYQLGFSGPSDHFYYSFYDTLSPFQYFGIQSWAQIGITANRHLLKSTRTKVDTTFYSYLIDSNHRVLAMYMDYDNSGWTYARAVDTTYYIYSCE